MELFPGDFSKGIGSLVSICQEQLDGKENVSNTLRIVSSIMKGPGTHFQMWLEVNVACPNV